MPRLDDTKRELMLVTLKHFHNLPTAITIGNDLIPFNQFVKSDLYNQSYLCSNVVHCNLLFYALCINICL